ncbi:hypothetical protein H6F86_21560 [Phormidium sp. FACHB-592]|uniref:DUF732 domain-containing protein n=1 Tax=Stenomitos frigidus AS-A4 TaxID=2933935 RepID=A0ABV0KFH2_9CYAN|nr:hypothetical protein [Phormidium sp. FACHB-592]MBD2076423.1 hypothetical protein [Phormidium sp. FACHB-592]
MRKAYLGTLLGGLPFFISVFIIPTALSSSINPSPICYIRLTSGRLIDLTSMCASGYPSRKNTAYSNDDAYLKEVQKFLGSNSGKSQAFQSLKSNPKLLTDAAKNYCNARLAGMSEQAIYDAKFKELEQSVQKSSPKKISSDIGQKFQTMMTATSVASRLASKVYCPNLTD